ncbi:AMP-binding protein, partial [Methanobrevibacter sp.]
SNLDSEDTLFKIKYDDNISIFDFIVSVKNTIDNALDNSMVNLRNYVKELYPDYCDYIFNYTIVNQTNGNYNKNKINSSIIFKISSESIEVEYDINTFTRFEIESMLENIEALLYNCLKDINQHCGDVDIVCNRQLDLLNDFSKGDGFELDDKLLPDIILEMAEKYPDNFAINDEINRINYKDFANLVESTTYILQNNYKITKYDKVILYLPRTYNIPLLTICLMKLGAITIPIDDSYPEAYIQNIINDSSAKYIIHESSCKFEDIELIELTSLQTDSLTDIKYNVDEDVDLDDTALILYTSGSTGVPKGVELTQRNIININFNYIDFLNIPEGGSGNFMCLAKFTFVASLPIYGALMHGFEAFIIREVSKESISNIVKYLKTYYCYLLISTQEIGLYLYNNFDLKLEHLALAGSSLSKQDIRSDNSTVLWNAYGCTETSGSVIINKLNKDYSDYSVIGGPLGNSKIYILDDNKKQLPIGAVGELVIGGPIVTKQYFNNPKQTSRSYGEFNGERVYFTNDLGYFNEEGSVVYVGRKDDQINLNGFRIEPDSVQSVISEFDDFNQVKVIMGKVNHQDHLIAYYSSDIDIDEVALKEYLSVHLPFYMVPSFYVHMDSLPLNPNGKVDVKRLPSVVMEDVVYVEPRNELERLVVNVFEKFFNQDNISVYDDFIQLGGTSVIAMKIVKELSGYTLSVNDLISLGTPEKIAGHIKNNTVMDLEYNKYSLDEGCPLNESQLNVYLDIVRYDKNDVYNIPLTINIPGIFSVDDIKDALYEMFNVHPILKSFINVIDGIPYLKTGSNPYVDYSDEYDVDVISDFISKSFDLNFTLSRFLLVDNDNDDGFVLVSVFHHLIFDGFSSLVFKEHLFDLLEGKELEFDDGFVKSSVYSEEIIKTSEYSDAEVFYEDMLCDVGDVSSLLSDVGDNEAGVYSFNLDVGKSDVGVLLRSFGVSENILFTGVFAYTLSRFTGDNKVLFNVLDNGRDNLSNYESIGMFVNTLPLLVDCGNNDVSSFMVGVRDLIFNVFSYNFYPFRVLAQKFNINSSILFQYQSVFEEVDDQFFNVSDLEFRISLKNNKYVVKVIYSSKFSSDTIRRFVESYKFILNDILNFEELSDISYVSCDDLALLDAYNDTTHVLDYVDVLDAFNDNLIKYPNNILMKCEDKSYTYGESAFIINEIASMLNGCG